MKKFKQFEGKIIDTILQNDDGKNAYFIIKFTDGTKMNIVGYISDDEHNKINLKAKTYESTEEPKLYIEENITDYMKKSKKLDESFINITVNIGKDDVLTMGGDNIPSTNVIMGNHGDQPMLPNDIYDGEEDVDYDEEDVDYDEEDVDYDEEDVDYDEEDVPYDIESVEYDEEDEVTEVENDDDFDEEDDDFITADEDEEEDEDVAAFHKAKSDYDEDEDGDFDEDEDFDEIDAEEAVEAHSDEDDEVLDDDDEEVVASEDIETVLVNQLASPEYNRVEFDFKDNKSGKDFTGIVLAKLSAGYFLFKTEEGVKKVHFNNVYED